MVPHTPRSSRSPHSAGLGGESSSGWSSSFSGTGVSGEYCSRRWEIATFINRQTILGAVIAACVLVAVSDRFYAYSTEALAQWLSTLLGTIFGASLAAGVGVWLFYYQGRRTEETRVEQLREALIAELYATIDRLKTTSKTRIPNFVGDGSDVWLVLTHLEPTACDEAIRSALFGHRNTVTLTQLARLMREYTQAASILSSLFYAPQVNRAAMHQMYEQSKNVRGLQQFVVLFCETSLQGFEAQGIDLPPIEKYYSDPSREAPPDYFGNT